MGLCGCFPLVRLSSPPTAVERYIPMLQCKAGMEGLSAFSTVDCMFENMKDRAKRRGYVSIGVLVVNH